MSGTEVVASRLQPHDDPQSLLWTFWVPVFRSQRFLQKSLSGWAGVFCIECRCYAPRMVTMYADHSQTGSDMLDVDKLSHVPGNAFHTQVE